MARKRAAAREGTLAPSTPSGKSPSATAPSSSPTKKKERNARQEISVATMEIGDGDSAASTTAERVGPDAGAGHSPNKRKKSLGGRRSRQDMSHAKQHGNNGGEQQKMASPVGPAGGAGGSGPGSERGGTDGAAADRPVPKKRKKGAAGTSKDATSEASRASKWPHDAQQVSSGPRKVSPGEAEEANGQSVRRVDGKVDVHSDGLNAAAVGDARDNADGAASPLDGKSDRPQAPNCVAENSLWASSSSGGRRVSEEGNREAPGQGEVPRRSSLTKEANSSKDDNPQRSQAEGPPAEATEARLLESAANVTSKRHQVLSVLQHRQMLLDRIRRCHKAAEGRLRQLPHKSHEQERAEFVSQTKEATKRNKSVTSPVSGVSQQQKATKRTSRRERKKSSAARDQYVYNDATSSSTSTPAHAAPPSSSAAVDAGISSAPVPGQNVRSDLSSGGLSTGTRPLHVATAVPGGAVVSDTGAIAGPASAFSAPMVVAGAAAPKHVHANIGTSPKSAAFSSTNGPGKTPKASSQHRHAPFAGQRPTSSKGGKRGSSSNAGSKGEVALSGPGASALHMKQKQSAGALCPEAMALREKRNALLAQLSLRRRAEMSQRSVAAPAPNSVAKSAPPAHAAGKSPQHAFRLSPAAPNRLPARRKTQWDYVMEEMRWLATDFVEERKWKLAAARTISGAIANNHHRTACIHAKAEQDPTPSDLASARAVARAVSCTIMEHYSAVVNTGLLVDDGRSIWKCHVERLTPRSDEVEVKSAAPALVRDEGSKADEDSSDDRKVAAEEDTKCCSVASANGPSQSRTASLQPPGASSKPSDQQPEDSGPPGSGEEEFGHDEIKNLMQTAAKASSQLDSSLGRLRATEIHKAQLGFSDSGVVPMVSQVKAVRWVESLWAIEGTTIQRGGRGNGAIFGGGFGSGKTVAAGCILWRHRSNGPQLVVCPPQSLIRWRHELQRFSGLNLFTLGIHGSAYDRSSVAKTCSNKPFMSLSSVDMSHPERGFEAGNVVLCEQVSLLSHDTCDESLLFATPWASVVVDLRFFAASTPVVKSSSGNIVQPRNASIEWWQALLNLRYVDGLSCRRLIVEGGWDGGGHVSPGERDILARKVAFVHPAGFRSSTRRVFDWAKEIAKDVSGVDDGDDQEGLRTVLQRAIDPFRFQIGKDEQKHVAPSSLFSLSDAERGESSGEESGGPKNRASSSAKLGNWDVMLCPMGSMQERAYLQCCNWVRGTLGMRGPSLSRNVAAGALLKLRRLCFHHDVMEALGNSSALPRIAACISQQKCGRKGQTATSHRAWVNKKGVGSSAAPNFEFAQALFNGSSKISELLRILLKEANVDGCVKIDETTGSILRCFVRKTATKPAEISSESDAQKSTPQRGRTSSESDAQKSTPQRGRTNRQRGRPTKSPRTPRISREPAPEISAKEKKVLILAVLPEIQLLLHLFLDACGIPHELLAARGPNEGASPLPEAHSRLGFGSLENTEARISSQCASASTWCETQRALARFNDGAENRPRFNVLIASPVTVGGAHGGMCASAADFVVSVDEDWSGRGGRLVEAIVRRCESYRRGKLHGKVRLIKLITRATCEATFLAGLEKEDDNASRDLGESNDTMERESADEAAESESDEEMDERSVRLETDRSGTIVGAIDIVSGKSHHFLGRRLLQWRDRKLSQVLHASPARDLATGREPIFLPSWKTSKRRNAQMRVLHGIAGAKSCDEKVIMGGNTDKGCGLSQKENVVFGNALADAESRACPVSIDIFSYCSDVRILACRSVVPPYPSVFPACFASRRDAVAMQARRHCERYGKALRSSDGVFGQKFQMGTASANGPVVAASETKLADIWHRAGLGCHPGEHAVSLLVYSMTPCSDSSASAKKKRNINEASECHATVPPEGTKKMKVEERSNPNLRQNAYSVAYSVNKGRIRDGHQCVEPVLYAPPLVPGILPIQNRDAPPSGLSEAPTAAVSPVFPPNENSQALQTNQRNLATTPNPTGRSSVGFVTRTTGKTADAVLKNARKKFTGRTNAATKLPLTSRAANSFGPQGSGLLASANQIKPTIAQSEAAGLVPAISPIPPKRTSSGPLGLSSSKSPFDTSRMDSAAEEKWDKEDNDYGLLGIGLLPTHFYSVRVAAATPIETTSYRFWNDPYELDPPICPLDIDEVWTSNAHFLDSMLLFVNRRQEALPQSSTATQAGQQGNSSARRSSFVKKQKKQQASASIATDGRASIQPLLDFSAGMFTSASSDDRGVAQLIPGGKAEAARASTHLQGRINDRLQNAFTASCALSGAGVRFASANATDRATSTSHLEVHRTLEIIKLADGAETGDKARAAAATQLASLRRSLVSPANVDFGPFGTGFLSAPKGMSRISPPNSKVGIKLPMGVKMQHREHDFAREPWGKDEDNALKEAALRYCFNWYIVSRAVTEASQKSVILRSVRSARQCRERWRTLMNIDPSIAKEVRKYERFEREMAMIPSWQVQNAMGRLFTDGSATRGGFQGTYETQWSRTCCELLVPKKSPIITEANATSDENDANGDMQSTTAPTVSQLQMAKNRFALLKSASVKKQIPPTVIPGGTDDARSQIAPSHPSHALAIQEVAPAFGGQIGGGPVDMWPLQLLDFADKQRTSVTSPMAMQQTSSTVSYAQPNTSAAVSSGSSTAVTSAPMSTTQPVQTQQAFAPPPPLQQPQQTITQQRALATSTPSVVTSGQTVATAQTAQNLQTPRVVSSVQQEQLKQAARAAALAPNNKPSSVKTASGRPSSLSQQQQQQPTMMQQHQPQMVAPGTAPTASAGNATHYPVVGGGMQTTSMSTAPPTVNPHYVHAPVPQPMPHATLSDAATVVGGAPAAPSHANPGALSLPPGGGHSVGVSPMRLPTNSSSSKGRNKP